SPWRRDSRRPLGSPVSGPPVVRHSLSSVAEGLPAAHEVCRSRALRFLPPCPFHEGGATRQLIAGVQPSPSGPQFPAPACRFCVALPQGALRGSPSDLPHHIPLSRQVGRRGRDASRSSVRQPSRPDSTPM